MSAPALWIGLLLLGALATWLLRRWSRLTAAVGTLFVLLLGLLAWLLPLGRVTQLGGLSLHVNETLNLFGRRFVLLDAERPLLLLIFLLATFWFGGAHIGRAGRLFVPTALCVVALLIAALAVEPFLYAGILIAMAVLLCVPLVVMPGQPVSRGVLRFLTFQLLGIPFILLTGWMLSGVATRPEDSSFVVRAAGLLGFGFGLLMGIFPFHSWILMLAEERNSYAATFVFVLLPWMASLLALTFLERYTWLRTAESLPMVLRLTGTVMVGVAGTWAAFERHLGRLLGYAVLAENGFMLLALSLPAGVSIHFAMLLPRLLSLGLWALALAVLQPETSTPRFSGLLGLAHRWPVASLLLVLAQFSVAGLPLLAGFPVRFVIWDGLAALAPVSALAALLPCAGFIISGLRSLAALVSADDEAGWQISESWPALLLLSMGLVALFAVGMLPQWFLPLFANGAQAFPSLLP